MKAILIAIAMALTFPSARAEFFTGNDLLEKLTSTNVVDKALGIGYVMGVHDAWKGIVICTPLTVTSGQASEIVRRALENAPETRHKAADSLTTQALSAVFPCAAKKSGTSERGA